MYKGPLFNDISIKFTTRNPLGYEGSSISLQRVLCPIINTVTPRPFYWAFMTWNYYEFWEYQKNNQNKNILFDKNFLRRNDFYFVLSHLLSNSNPASVAGITKASDYLNPDINDVEYLTDNDKIYLQTKFGGMQYYNAGCESFGFIARGDTKQYGTVYRVTDNDEENFVNGQEIANLFKDVIKDTDYYKTYIHSFDNPVPKKVLEDYGKTIKLNLDGFDNIKTKFKSILFDPLYKWHVDTYLKKYLISSHDIINLLIENKIINKHSGDSDIRHALFDKCDFIQPDGDNTNLISTIKGWGLVCANQYAVLGVEYIFKYMLNNLNIPKTEDMWINDCIKGFEQHSIRFDQKISTYLDKFDLTSSDIERLLAESRNNEKKIADNVLQILFSLVKRYDNNQSISLALPFNKGDVAVLNFVSLLQKNKNKTVEQFLKMFMSEYIIKQHSDVCYRKLRHGNDGFYFNKIENIYFYRSDANKYSPELPGLRLTQLLSVMNDLGETIDE